MLKWISKRNFDANSWRAWLLLPDLERLLELRERHETSRIHADAQFSQIVSTIWVNETNKRTRPHRLRATVAATQFAWAPSHCGELTFLDLGASDGLCTQEAAASFRAHFNVRVSAVAIDQSYALQRFDRGLLQEYRMSDGSPVLLRFARIGLRLGRRLRLRPAELLRRFYLRRSSFRAAMRATVTIPLIHPRALDDSDLVTREADVLQLQRDLIGSADIVRVSNLLNHTYFSNEQMSQILAHCHRYLRDGGLLVVSGNASIDDTEIEQGTLWRRSETGFEWLHDFGGGSKIQQMVSGVKAVSAPQSTHREASVVLCAGVQSPPPASDQRDH